MGFWACVGPSAFHNTGAYGMPSDAFHNVTGFLRTLNGKAKPPNVQSELMVTPNVDADSVPRCHQHPTKPKNFATCSRLSSH